MQIRLHLSARKATVLLGMMAVAVTLFAVPAVGRAATFNPENIISDAQFRAWYAMSETDIQAFLNKQKGPLKSLVTPDYAGKKKTAAKIIYEACRQWHVNPKVMLVMLQKEQSLLTRTTLAKNTLARAIGAGCPNASTNKYPGFGKQIWYGARLLDGYGEGKNGSKVKLWKAPYTIKYDIYKHPNVAVRTRNVATYKLFVYNPSIGAKKPYGDLSKQKSSLSGNANFWKIYWHHFGSPTANPAGYHTRLKVVRKSYLWNTTIGTKRRPAPARGGIVATDGKKVMKRNRGYIRIWWGGNRTGGWYRYDYVRWQL